MKNTYCLLIALFLYSNASFSLAYPSNAPLNSDDFPPAANIEHKGKHAIELDGENDYISIPHHESLLFGNTVTVEAWIFPTDLSARYAIFSTRANNEAGSWQLEVGNASTRNNVVAVTGVNTWVAVSKDNVIVKNSWNHIAFVKNDTEVKLFVNGQETELQTTTAYNFVDNESIKVIGSGTNGFQLFPGKIDEVRLWNVALGQADIQHSMRDYLAGNEAGLAAYYRFDEGAGSEAFDNSQNSNTGTLVGSPIWVPEEFAGLVALDFNLVPEGSAETNHNPILFYNQGEEVDISVIPNQGFEFVEWTGDTGSITSGDVHTNEITITMPDIDIAITANLNEPFPLCEALDNCDFEFTAGGNAKWFGQNEVTHDGIDAAQSGEITHNQQSWLETTVEGPGTLSFWWKVSSESDFDFLRFYINDAQQDAISGEVDWQLMEYTLGEGANTIKWAYTKDGSVSHGSDCGWVDQLIFEEAGYFNLSLNANPPDGGSVEGSDVYYEGAPVTVNAIPAEGYLFANWTNEEDEEVSEQARYNFNMPDADITLTANFTDQVPEIAINPEDFEVTLESGDVDRKHMVITNNGDGILNYTIKSGFWNIKKNSFKPENSNYHIDLTKGEKDYRTGSYTTKASGGPDEFGYIWIDSDEPTGPVYTWNSIAETGTYLSTVSNCDDCTQKVALSFDFPYYGDYFNEITVESNGFIAVTNVSSQYTNQPLPSTNAQPGIIAGFWDDLYPGRSEASRIYFEDYGNYAVFQYDAVRYFSGDGTATFQIILFDDGEIRFHYNEISGTKSAATIGMQNLTQDIGLQIVFNSDYIKDNHAISIRDTPYWLSYNPISGSIESGNAHTIDVTFDATYKNQGTYEAFIFVESNDPLNPKVSIPAIMNVTGIPGIALDDESLDFGYAKFATEETLPLTITNTGTAPLEISDIQTENVDFYTNITELSINPGQSRDLSVYFYAEEPGTFESQLSFTTNVDGQESFSIALNAEIVIYELTLVANPEEGGTVEGDGNYQEGDEVAITANPVEGYMFINWTNDENIEVSDQETYTFIMPDADITLTANFTDQLPEIKVDPESLNQLLGFNESAEQTLTIFNNGIDNSVFLEWTAKTNIKHYKDKSHIFNYPANQGVDADNQNSEVSSGTTYNNQDKATKDLFDLLDHFPVAIGEAEYSVATDGKYIYTTQWNGNAIYKYEMDGSYIESFTIEGASNIRDLTYDGQYFYGSPNSTTIYIMDFTNEVLIGTITAPSAVRGIAYDSENDGFWITNGWNPPIRLIDRNGDILQTINPTIGSMAGLAWDNVSGRAPCLWAYTQTGNGHDLKKIDLESEEIADVFDVTSTGIIGGTSAGGLTITSLLVPGKWVFLGISQNDVIWVIELTDAWFSTNPTDGKIPAGESTDVTVVFNSFNLDNGIYKGEIKIVSNDLNTPEIIVPVELEVKFDLYVDMDISDESLDFGSVKIETEETLPLTITNTGTSTLEISDIQTANIAFSANVAELSIHPGQSKNLSVSFYAEEQGTFESQLSFTTNVDGQETINIPLSAEIVFYDLTLIANPEEGGTVEGAGEYQEGDEVPITANPAQGYIFANWTNQEDEEVSAQVAYTFYMPNTDKTLTANFTDQIPEIAVDKESFEENLEPGQTSTQYLTISNEALGSLNWNIRTEYIFNFKSRNLGDYADESRKSTSTLPVYESPDGLAKNTKTAGNIIATYANSSTFNTGMVWVNNYLYMLQLGNNQLLKYDIRTESIVEKRNIHAEPYGITWDGEYLWIGNGAGNVYAYNLDGTSAEYSFSAPFSTYPALTWDGQYFIVNPAFQNNPSFYRLDETGSIIESFTSAVNMQSWQIVYVPEHTEGHIWSTNGLDNKTFQLTLEAGTASLVQEFNNPTASNEAYAIAHNGFDLWWSDYGGPIYQIDDGILEFGWLAYDIESGSTPSGKSQVVEVTLDAAELEDGTYKASLTINSNDPANLKVVVPVTLHVTGYPRITLSDESLDFGSVKIATEETLTLTINNTGTAALEIYDIQASDAEFYTNESELSINPGQSHTLLVSFYADEPGTFESQLGFNTNVEGQETFNILLSAEIVFYDLTLIANPSAGGTVEGQGKYQEGDEVTVTATTGVGYEFLNWRKEGAVISSDNPHNFNMPAEDITIAAHFITEGTETYTVTLSVNDEAFGEVMGTGDYVEGESVTVIAIPIDDYLFLYWTDEDDDLVSADAQYTFEMPGEDVALTAKFADEPEIYRLRLVANPNAGGKVSGRGNYEAGRTADIEASANSGYYFINWTDGAGNLVSGQQKYSYTMPNRESTITANFALITYTVTFTVEDEDGNDITDAVITIGDETNEEGEYVFENVEPESYDYIVSVADYLNNEGTVNVVNSNVNEKVTMVSTFIESYKDIEVSIFPNPTRNKFTVESNEKISHIRLIDLNGQVIKNKVVDEFSYEVNVHELRTGVYFMQVHTENGVITEKVQIAR